MRMVPPGFAVVAMVIATVVLVNGEMNLNEQPIWSDACKGSVCGVAEQQAEGLARLKVLSDYVKETMALMASVISSLDDEMMEVGQELTNVVGRRCHSRGLSALTSLVTRMNHAQEHEIENGITEVTSASDNTWASSDMTQGSTSPLWSDVDGASHSTSQRPSSGSHSTTHSTSHSTNHSISHRPNSGTFNTSRSISQRPGSTSQSNSDSIISQSRSTVSHSSQKYAARPSASIPPLYVAPEPPLEVSNGRGGGGRGHGRGRGQGKGKGQSRGRSQGQGQGQGRDRSQGQGQGQGGFEPRASKCRGVPEGSPHYVPYLDSWCATTCAHSPAMCPPTHCVC